MESNFSAASSLAAIDRQIDYDNERLSPAQYEIVRQVIYRTADFEYADSLKFSEGVLFQGVKSLINSIPIVVDVPEIQVSIVPQLQQTFRNPVYCCATTSGDQGNKEKIVSGLITLAKKHPQGIFIIGQSEAAVIAMDKFVEKKAIQPSLVIATAPMLVEPKKNKRLGASPCIYLNGSKGCDTVSTAVFNTLVRLAWRAHGKQIIDKKQG